LGGRSENRMNALVFKLPMSETYVGFVLFILGISIYNFSKTASLFYPHKNPADNQRDLIITVL